MNEYSNVQERKFMSSLFSFLCHMGVSCVPYGRVLRAIWAYPAYHVGVSCDKARGLRNLRLRKPNRKK